ncbi:tetratricopeptide repeat protein [Streptomyces bicolor]|uniref:tetratricopeptide repeat protein n=1 Tax=Streptomyces bicolor TaxID=66874 RepID=UPI0004E11F83|nr:tetratricopeptide repeat protein [Streptomyces bicolor]
MAPRTNDNAPEHEENSTATGADAAAAGGKSDSTATTGSKATTDGTDERVAAVRRLAAMRPHRPARLGVPPLGEFEDEAPSGPKRGSGGGSPQGPGLEGAAPLEDGTGRSGGGEKTADQRVTAVRRAAAAGRRHRALHLAGCAALLAVALTAGSIAIGAVHDNAPTNVAPASAAVSPGLLTTGDLDTAITSLQAHLRTQPRDFTSWATLGLAYVEQARTNGDPSRYPQAAQAFKRSLSLSPDNDQALAGRAALAAARHDFEDALKYADQALKVNPYSERALCTRVDALVELGRYTDASKAADTADDRRPGIPVFTRYAYVHELRGDVRTAQRVLDQALSSAVTPGDIAYVATQLGQLAWNQGDYDTALTHYARALAVDENYVPALEGRARAQAASGDTTGALNGLRDVVSRYPLPGPLVELGELYESAGDKVKADDQYALVDAWTALARANGVNADLDTALAAADHGDKASALRAARAEWDRRQTVHTADALAWALHVNGKDEEALPYARKATATGYRNAAFRYHRGIIERATGHSEDAREHLRAALGLNPGFSPLGAREARKALKDLEAAK